MSIAEMEKAIHDTLAANEFKDAYIRLVVTRGAGTLGLDPNRTSDPQVIIITDKIAMYPVEYYEQGMSIITASTIRNHPAALSPRIKSLNYLNNILAKIEAKRAGAHEAVMLNHLGLIAECAADNLFLVIRGALKTPELVQGALPGITRACVLEIAAAAGIPTAQCALAMHDVYNADEAFVTGTGAEIVAAVSADGRKIGNGRPGPITRKLVEAFRSVRTRDGAKVVYAGV
jgi:branched-chain amino acid aminotransferase